jgi:hypothetical protein
MDTDFKVINENTFSFKDGELYVMLLRENGEFGVEVVDREKTFGRKITQDYKTADFLFESVINRLSQYKCLEDAENAIMKCFAFDSLDKLLFVLIMDDRISSQSDIVSIESKFNFIIRLKFGYRKKIKNKNSITIYVYEKITDKKPYALLYGSDMANDMRFELL